MGAIAQIAMTKSGQTHASGGAFWVGMAFVAAGLTGGALSVLVGELVSSGLMQDLITGWQTAGNELGGAINNVSHGEIEFMKRGAAIGLRALA